MFKKLVIGALCITLIIEKLNHYRDKKSPPFKKLSVMEIDNILARCDLPILTRMTLKTVLYQKGILIENHELTLRQQARIFRSL